ncbi:MULTISPECIES: class I adenylate-forming enzyme family protein [unclassified Sphingobium]|uniref:class I adenylate-forming enzyme family protein n=1 Tax=unclassified Sphingobium TaxID=2611147 RepID=UPI00077059C4|nr:MULTISPECIES: class I adenylate-forming enzyme family protein [unclassified Sphingobium]AMK21500.1 Acyl-CoA synthetases (AMP-forming)/AMP-acid ligases II [Sphingobium sp. TKS]NML91867.1 acyl--CoA ligase [Sphingobium sp. TB-6]
MIAPPKGKTLATVVAEKATANPAHPAILYGEEVIGYGALRDMVELRALALDASGIRAGDRIGILIGNEPEWVAMALAAAAVGATLAPLNTWYKAGELAWTIRHCGLSLVVAASRFLNADFAAMLTEIDREGSAPSLRKLVFLGDAVPGYERHDAFVDRGRAAKAAGVMLDPEAVDPDSPAYVLYTSGSTAEPKGVLLNHRGVVENGFELGQRRAIGPQDRTWLGTPLFYALGATNALPATFTAGATLVLQGAFEAGAAIDIIERTGATVYYGTGNMSRAIIDHPAFTRARIATLKKGNAGLGAEYKRLTLVEMGIEQAVPAYGLTETYGNAAVGRFDDPLEVKMATDGAALPGQEIRIVDPESGAPLAAGELGLILVRGNVTSGYLDNPEETGKALRPDGFFDTGDLGTLDGEGRLRFHSRLKEVIKSGGINVSPVEVEQLLTTHPDVRDAHVVGLDDPVRGQLIVAFVDPLRPVDEAALKAFVKERAAAFKVPHHVFLRSEAQLPRLATGKIAKARLKQEAAEMLAS